MTDPVSPSTFSESPEMERPNRPDTSRVSSTWPKLLTLLIVAMLLIGGLVFAALKLRLGIQQAPDTPINQEEIENDFYETEAEEEFVNPDTLDIQVESETLPTDQPNQDVISCGGWDTSGEVRCECDGLLTKSSCPADAASCDSGSYFCAGTCGMCCFDGPAENAPFALCED